MVREINSVGNGGVETSFNFRGADTTSFWSIDNGLPGKSQPFDIHDNSLLPPTAEYNKGKSLPQRPEYYLDVIVGDDVKKAPPVLGNPDQKAKALQQPIVPVHNAYDTVLPYSHSEKFDPVDFGGKSQQKAATNEKSKAIHLPVPPTLELSKPLIEKSKPALESPKIAEKSAKKSTGIFHRFVDWVTGFFRKKPKNTAQDVDDDGMPSKLASPAQRNAEAIRDCLKQMNKTLDQFRDAMENDLPGGEMFDILVDEIHRYDDIKKQEIAFVNKDMIERNKEFKVAHLKYMEALNGTMFLPKLMKWVLKPLDILSTATAIAAFGLLGASVIFGLVTGGTGAVLGAIATVSTYFIVMQSLAFIGKGSVKVLQALGQHKQDKHYGQMLKARHQMDELTIAIQEDMKKTLGSTSEISKAWENLSSILQQRSAAINQFKN